MGKAASEGSWLTRPPDRHAGEGVAPMYGYSSSNAATDSWQAPLWSYNSTSKECQQPFGNRKILVLCDFEDLMLPDAENT